MSPDSNGKLKILLVEDEPDLAAVVGRQLKRHGFEVVFADSRPDAVSTAVAEMPDVILMDVTLEPEPLGGFEATREIKANPVTQRIPVIALSGGGISYRPQALQVGCHDFEDKPVEIARLVTKIRTLLGGKP